jgi:hypothetical protein
MTANTGARPIGAALGGALGVAFGPTSCILLAGLLVLVRAAIIWASPVRRLERLPEPSGAARAAIAGP